jgi:Tol biopolymer transport system component
LAYIRGGVLAADDRSIMRVDRSGAAEPLAIPPRPVTTLRLSPDGQQLAFATSGRDRDIWFFSLTRGTLSRLPIAGRHSVPIWTPDGEWITYASSPTGVDRLYRARADGTHTTPEEIVLAEDNLVPGTWTPDGRELLYYRISNPPGVWVRDTTSGGEPLAVSAAATLAGGAALSPDGRWLAYDAAESGRNEVFVQPYPGPGRRHQISTDGGISPVWRGDGRELFYVSANENASGNEMRMMAVTLDLEPELSLGTPTMLFAGRYEMNVPARSYDVSADGEHFFLLRADAQPASPITQIAIVENWFAELERLVPRRTVRD